MTDQKQPEEKLDLIVSCAFGLEAIVKRELIQLGVEPTVISPGRILFSGDARDLIRANIWLRSADRVLVRISTFPAADFDALFESTKEIEWAKWIDADQEFPVVAKSLKSQLTSTPACQRAVKKAIVESLMKGHGVSELVETGAKAKVELALDKDQATLTLDTTGPSLHKRGYRQFNAPAPLKETLAAAMIQLSFWDRTRPLVDPFCGSGTIAIEAAMIGRQMAPGKMRDFAAEQWSWIPKSTWQDERRAAILQELPGLEERIVGSDIDTRALYAARQNAIAAGVDNDVHFQERDFSALSTKRKYGCLITNPPYGSRIGLDQDLEELYRSIPLVLRNLPTWSHYILTAYPGFERLVERRADRRRKLYNGRIECTYFQFHGPHPKRPSVVGSQTEANEDPQLPSAIESSDSSTLNEDLNGEPGEQVSSENKRQQEASQDSSEPAVKPSTKQVPKKLQTTPVFGGLSDKSKEQAELFARRLSKRARHLRRWPTRQGITCYRLYEKDIPEIPLVVDRYEDHLHLTEYERPHDRSSAEHADWLDLMAKTAAETLEVPLNQTFLKRRQRQRGTLQYEKQARSGYEIQVQEGDLKFLVNLSDYVDTGLFLDHRITRSMVKNEAAGKHFLNLFAYTGSFSVCAAAGGAKTTTTVDWSHAYLDWAKRNLKLNGFGEPEHRTIRADAREFFHLNRADKKFDLVVVDPPTFSNSKRTDEDWDVQSGHVELLRELHGHLAMDAVVYFSTNFRRFKMSPEVESFYSLREISKQTVPDDFRNQRIHRCWRMQKVETQ